MDRPRGHRILEHTADMALEGWADTRAGCLAEAVRALAASFVELRDGTYSETVAISIEPADGSDQLVRLLDEAVYMMDARGRVAVDAAVDERTDGGLSVRFAVVPADAVELVGAVPKAVSLHGLELAESADGWRCHVTVDV